MSRPHQIPTGNERRFGVHEIIVSKTDLQGKITYINRLFETISDYQRDELLGKPHNIIRHPDMPRTIFDLAWETLKQGNEIFAYVKNMCKNGDHYWVLAHMVPSYDTTGTPVGYHSNRRHARQKSLDTVQALYSQLLSIEKNAESPKEGLKNGRAFLDQFLEKQNILYDEFIFSLAA